MVAHEQPMCSCSHPFCHISVKFELQTFPRQFRKQESQTNIFEQETFWTKLNIQGATCPLEGRVSVVHFISRSPITCRPVKQVGSTDGRRTVLEYLPVCQEGCGAFDLEASEALVRSTTGPASSVSSMNDYCQLF